MAKEIVLPPKEEGEFTQEDQQRILEKIEVNLAVMNTYMDSVKVLVKLYKHKAGIPDKEVSQEDIKKRHRFKDHI